MIRQAIRFAGFILIMGTVAVLSWDDPEKDERIEFYDVAKPYPQKYVDWHRIEVERKKNILIPMKHVKPIIKEPEDAIPVQEESESKSWE